MDTYTRAQVRADADVDRLLVTHADGVYDLTDFARLHPGGAALVEINAGKDVTAAMQDARSHAHSHAAFETLAKYRVGSLAGSYSKQNGRVNNNDINCGIPKCMESDNEAIISKGATCWKQESLVDWEAPMLSQVPRLGSHYFDWVHTPVLGHDIRFFASATMESLSVCAWWVIPSVWLPVVVVMLVIARGRFAEAGGSEVYMPLIGGGITIPQSYIPLLFLIGHFIWTFLEYVIHRWLFHLRPSPRQPWMMQLHFLMHGQHHKSPMDRNRLVFPPAPAAFMSVLFLAAFRLALPPATAYAVFAGGVFGYICYDLTHYYLHYGSPTIPYFRRLKHYHIQHHFTEQQKGFGITAKLWDYPFGTLISNEAERSFTNDR